jgi:acetylornithine deacetylase/succinyl-diaminopimelate desuccinylase-like protein
VPAFYSVAIGLLLLISLATPIPAFAQAAPATELDRRLQQLVSSVSETRLAEIVNTLAGFGTRNTLSGTTSTTRGIGAARQWIFDELRRSSPRLQVSFDTYKVAKDGRITRNVELRNILAVLPGKSPRRIYLTAHYDTVNIGEAGQIGANTRALGQRAADPQLRADQNYDIDAPGANDNGSGTALTMELARVMATSGLEFDATIVFALWAGEEQGLVGSRAHVQRLAANKVSVDANFNNDIVGNSHGGSGVVDGQSVRVYSEGPEDSGSRSLARYVARVASLYVPSHRVRLMARPDRFARGSDHASFAERGYAAIAFREANENFEKQHSALDTVDGVDFTYLAQNARVNAASIAALALAPPAPVVTNQRGQAVIGRQPSGYDAHLQWLSSPGATGYRIYWRETWSNDWRESRLIADETEFTLPGVSIDDHVFGVAAVGADGHESLVSAYVEQRQKRGPVKLQR